MMNTQIFFLYADRSDVSLSCYVLGDSPDLMAGKKRPAILICPGGGYFNCSDREAEPIALKFASMGYHTFVLRYSTYTGTSGFPDLTKPMEIKESCIHPHPMHDIAQAMRLIRAHADEWLVDAERIAVCGFSAGGHNAAMYATRWQEDADNPRPAAAILGYPLTDYVYKRDEEARLDPMAQSFFRKSDFVFLGTETPTQEQLVDVSPAQHVSERTPPTFLWATAADELVPVQHSLLMAKALADHNVPFELHVFETGMHGLALADQTTSAAWSQTNSDVAKWAELAGAWLQKRFALPLAEKTEFEEMLERGEFPGMGNAEGEK